MMKKCSVNLLKYGLAKHLKKIAQIDINVDPVFASSKGVFSANQPAFYNTYFTYLDYKLPPSIISVDLKGVPGHFSRIFPSTTTKKNHHCHHKVYKVLLAKAGLCLTAPKPFFLL
jgi:hypothetical protein